MLSLFFYFFVASHWKAREKVLRFISSLTFQSWEIHKFGWMLLDRFCTFWIVMKERVDTALFLYF